MENLSFHTSKVDSFSGFSRPFEESRYVVLGVPYDHTSTYRAGSRFAPRAIREASLNVETYSPRTGVDIENVPIYDAGDLHVVDSATETLSRLEKVAKELVSASKIPVVIGGEHTITQGVVRCLPNSVGVVSFDAHGDLRDEYGGGKISHATVLRRVTEKVGVEEVLVLGIRALCKEEVEFIQTNNIQTMTPWQIREIGIAAAIERVRSFTKRFQHTYLTIDMDGLDPAFAPGVSNPEFNGLTPDELISLALAVVDSRMVGFDLVEVCPNYDSGQSAVAAARIMFEVIAQAEKTRRR
ncbi:MAG TPA: agmatinase [Terriglobales bacterium]|nr:agmatinase [Terriglobales bacterium]